MADERNEPTFNPSMTSVKLLTEGRIDVGSRFAATTHSRRRDVDMIIEVTGYDRPRRLASTTTMDGADINGTLTFDAHPAGTRMRWSWEIHTRGVSKLLGPPIARIGKRQEDAIWAGLKQHLDAMPPHEGA